LVDSFCTKNQNLIPCLTVKKEEREDVKEREATAEAKVILAQELLSVLYPAKEAKRDRSQPALCWSEISLTILELTTSNIFVPNMEKFVMYIFLR
jgi:hypothetical protein